MQTAIFHPSSPYKRCSFDLLFFCLSFQFCPWDSAIDICSDWTVCELKYVDDVLLLSEDLNKLWVVLEHLNHSVVMFAVGFVPLTCKLLL